jgi:hypothetical protein
MTKFQSLYLRIRYIHTTRYFYFAHHPLCETYQSEVIHWKNYYFCKGCFFGYLGILFGIITGIMDWLPLDLINQLPPYLLMILVPILLLPSFFSIFFRLSRWIKNIIRFLMGTAIGLTASIVLFYDLFLVKMITLAVCIIGYFVFTRIRKRFKKDLCQGCSFLDKEQVCPGFEMTQKYIKEFEQYASDYIQSNYPPIKWNGG